MQEGQVSIESVTGGVIRDILPDLVNLRLTIFREYPYLYAGEEADELRYLAHYGTTDDGMVLLARHEGKTIGAITGIPLSAEDDALVRPFRERGDGAGGCYYVGEALLLPGWRGEGVGSRLLDALIHTVSGWGRYRRLACATIHRNPHDPRQPAGHIPIDGFCFRHGFVRHPELAALIPWREIDGRVLSHELVFWMRTLGK
jgi:GNAT superfamily N-acetyltransferase